MENKSKELEVAIKAALEAGKIVGKYFQTELLKEFKEDKSIVTLADKESEAVIKKIILESFPNHSIMGEETGMSAMESEYTWYIDPVDGTTNFANGIPIFAISIGLVYKEEIIVGVVYNPVINNLFYAEKDKGAYLNDKKIVVSKDDEKVCIVTTGSSRQKQDKELARSLGYSLWDKVKSTRVLGSTALELAYLACGSIEANISMGLSVYDFAGGVILVKEAGGKITNFDGSEWKLPANYFIASNGVFHDLLVEEVRNQKAKLGIA